MLASSAQPRFPRDDDWFLEKTAESGLIASHQSGRTAGHFTIGETFGSGVAIFDFDRDGWMDLLCLGGGTISPHAELGGVPPRLFRNDAGRRFVDETEKLPAEVAWDYTYGAAAADYDGDGFCDLFVTCHGRSRLLQNDAGGRFVDVTKSAGIDLTGWHTACCFADFNGDGAPDLFVAGYLQWNPSFDEVCNDPGSKRRDVCMPGSYPGAADSLWLNQRDGAFRRAGDEYGVLTDGKGLGVVADDFDDDGDVDVYVANDVVRNHFYLNDGTGRLAEQAVLAGVAGNEFGAPEGSMGVDAGDIDGDGRPEIFVANYENEDNSLYRNEGGGTFTHRTVRFGLSGGCRPFVGFGTLFADFDSDGWLDLAIANGHVTYRNRKSGYAQPAKLYRNASGARFDDVTDAAGPWFSIPHVGRGLAAVDWNNDGAIDLVVTEQDGPTSLLENRKRPSRWIGVDLRGPGGTQPPVGSTIQLDGGPRHAARRIRAGGSYLCSSDARLVLPAPPDSDEAVIVVSGPLGVQRFPQRAVNCYHLIELSPKSD